MLWWVSKAGLWLSTERRVFQEALMILTILIIVVAHIVWLIERRQNFEQFPKSYIGGIDDSGGCRCLCVDPGCTDVCFQLGTSSRL